MPKIKLKEWRERRAFSQAELADLAGVSKLTVTRLERPEPATPHPRTVRKLAEALGIDPEDLYLRQEEPNERWQR